MSNDEWITPKTDIPYNFGRASAYDEVVYTCQRPGGEVEPGTMISTAMVEQQVAFLQQQQHITHVLILLDDNELQEYAPPGLVALYEKLGLHVHHQRMGERGASQNILNLLEEIHQQEQQQKVVVHCTHGMGRSGRVAAAWVAAKYQKSPQQATDIVMDYAQEHGIQRLGNVAALTKWLGDASL